MYNELKKSLDQTGAGSSGLLTGAFIGGIASIGPSICANILFNQSKNILSGK